MYRLLACLLALPILCGFRPVPMPPPAPASARVALSLVDRDSGRELPEYRHGGRAWVPAAPGHRYAVRLRNLTGERLLVVLSVDGVNAITGQTAAPEQPGYVLGPWQDSEIAGWRKSSSDVAQFVFTDHGDSYASRTGRPTDVGVVGIAVFGEARPPSVPHPPVPPRPLPRLAAPASAVAAESARQRSADGGRPSLGTGHGARERSDSASVQFQRAGPRPLQIATLRYDAYARLAALGIVPGVPAPRAFPAGFVPDPPARPR
ncbi:hypothetical protein [Stenotrophomonas mori]|uniref:Uncharacterized protein n=1 Tax=Stenotrophomonas mori TaxID=2871096 RepID=A0ABT0SHQ5_9GAMM|nr:hypothetical protein [Stenotrophomonas mori]MCL7714598.1 hypothetical protein [Stenotrophomonas mori]